jgi:integration host factor subunit alpha
MAETTMTRVELVEALLAGVESGRNKMNRQECARFLEAALESISQTLARGEVVKLSRFGNFVVRAKRQRLGRNPKTGKAVAITPRRVVTFRPSPMLRQQVGGAKRAS